MPDSTRYAAEILTVGDELLRGEVVNSNAAWLAADLFAAGFEVQRVVTVHDDVPLIAEAVREATQRADLLIISGGLGPTEDDLTARGVALAAAAPLVCDRRALAAIHAFFAAQGRTPTANNDRQAWIPEGALALPNACGTAPGFMLRLGRSQVYGIPGVPKEARTMFAQEIAPRLRRDFELQPALVRTVHVFGLGESEIDERLAGIGTSGGAVPGALTLHYRTSFPQNHVTLIQRLQGADDGPRAAAALSAAVAEAKQRLGMAAYGEDEDTLPALVIAALRQRGDTLGVAESCTGGRVGDLLTDVPGSSAVFSLALVPYAAAMKTALLGVSPALLAQEGAVSQGCVVAMAEGMRRRFAVTHALALSGLSGPGGGNETQPVGTVHFAVASAQGLRHLHRVLPYDRKRVKCLAAHLALWLIYVTVTGAWSGDGDLLSGRWSPR